MKSIKGILFALVSSGTFGLIALFSVPLKQEGMNDISILIYRFLFSTLMIGLVCLIRKESFKLPKDMLPTLFVLGVLYAATAYFLLWSYDFIPTGIATTIHFMYPIMVAALMIMFFKEQKSIIILIAAILSVLGVVFLCWTGSEHIRIAGLVVAGVTVITYSLYIVGVNQSKAGRMSAEILTFYILLSGALIFLILGAVSPNGLQPLPSNNALIRLLSLAFLCTVISDFALILAIKLVGSTITSILGSMEPLVAVIIGIFYFGESFGLMSFIGLMLIIASVTLVVIISGRNNKKKELKEKLL